jgi:hypothetical protein
VGRGTLAQAGGFFVGVFLGFTSTTWAADPIPVKQVECDAARGAVSLTVPAGSEDRATPAWRERDGAVRILYLGKRDGTLYRDDRTCSKPGARWTHVVLKLGDQDDRTKAFGIGHQFIALPRTVSLTVDAGAGDFDEILGHVGRDLLDGGEGADELRGYGGRDRIVGGAGADGLFGAGQADVIEAVDGEPDLVVCGRGRDTAFVDPVDDVKPDCENVRKRTPG